MVEAKHWERTGIVTEAMKDALVGAARGEDLMQSIGPVLRDKLAIEGLTSYYGGRVVLTAAGKNVVDREKRRIAAGQKRAQARVAKRRG